VQGEGLLQNRGDERAPTVVGDIPPVTFLTYVQSRFYEESDILAADGF
jgi:hypothetical protein